MRRYIGWLAVPTMMVMLSGCNSGPPKVLLGDGQGLPGQSQNGNQSQGQGTAGSANTVNTSGSNGTGNGTGSTGNGSSQGGAASNTAGGIGAGFHPTSPATSVPFDSPYQMGGIVLRVMTGSSPKSLDTEGKEVPAKGDTWQTVRLVIENKGTSPVKLTSKLFELASAGSGARQFYPVSALGDKYLAGLAVVGQTVDAGATVVGDLAFDVPSSTTHVMYLVVLYNHQKAWFSYI